MPIVINDKEYRNLQEQVEYLTEELKKLKQSMGGALPNPIAGPQGDPGEQGEKGEPGRTPRIAFGYGPLPDTGYENGDIYIARGSTNGLTKGNMYLRVNNTWQLQLNLVGPQGPQGLDGGSQVIANPEEGYSDFLNKIDIDGVIYGIPTGNYVKYITAPESTTLTDEEIANIIDGVFIEGTFLGYKNPVLFPAGDNGSSYRGLILSTYGDAGASSIQLYSINKESKVISTTGERVLTLSNIYSINGIFIPDYPDNPENDKVLVFNTSNQLVWQNKPTAGMTIYRHNVNCVAVVGGYNLNLEFIFESSLDSAIADTSELWSYIYVYQLCNFIGAVSVINNKGSLSIEIKDIKTGTITTVNKADITVNSDTFSAI